MMVSSYRIEPAPTMNMIDFVRQTLSSTLPLLLGEVLKQLISDLRMPSTSRRLRRQLELFGLEFNALSVLLTEAMPVNCKVNQPQSASFRLSSAKETEHHSGVPPPSNRYIHD